VRQSYFSDISAQPKYWGEGMNDGYRCELCGTWVEYHDLNKVLAHEGPLPHVEQDLPALGKGTDHKRKKPSPG
jgi:hypothetical protein